jgi:HEAT repeat protein
MKTQAQLVAQLIASLDTRSDRAAEAVLEKLRPHGRVATTALLKAARDPARPFIRKWSLQGLGAMGDRRAVDPLIDALADERMSVRLHAIRGLGRLGSDKAVAPLIRCFRDVSGGVRMNALQSLVAMGAKKIPTRALREALRDPKWYVRQLACRLAGTAGARTLSTELRTLAEKDPRLALERLRPSQKLASSRNTRRVKR